MNNTSHGKIGYYFPTPIESSVELELAEKLLPIAKQYLSNENYITNMWNYKNTYDGMFGLAKMDDVSPFTNYVKERAYSFLHNCGYDSSTLKFSVQVFFSEMFNGDFHRRHTHPNCVLSGILYLQTPENSAKLVVYDPKPHRKFVSLSKSNVMMNVSNPEASWDRVFFTPEVGSFLMWESWLEHEVPINQSIEGRITAVFNIRIVDEY
jgi:uncharacterized protein (TIGR02466 family)